MRRAPAELSKCGRLIASTCLLFSLNYGLGSGFARAAGLLLAPQVNSIARSQPAAATIGLIFVGALSAFFDQDRQYASAVIIKIPTMLTTICIQMAPEISTNTKSAAKD